LWVGLVPTVGSLTIDSPALTPAPPFTLCPCTSQTCQQTGCSCTCGTPTFVCSAIYGYNSPTCNSSYQFVCASGQSQCSLPPPTGGCGSGAILACTGSGWDCVCTPGNCSTCPIIIDTQNQGFHLTDWKDGVRFNFFPGLAAPEQLSWTDPDYANGWLVLPNADGLVVNGTQLFGNITPSRPARIPTAFWLWPSTTNRIRAATATA